MLVGVPLARAARNWDDRLALEHDVPDFHGGDAGWRRGGSHRGRARRRLAGIRNTCVHEMGSSDLGGKIRRDETFAATFGILRNRTRVA